MGCFSTKTSESERLQLGVIGGTNEGFKIAASSFITQRNGNIRDSYLMGAKLGSGAFGFVRLGTNLQTGQRRAIKTIQKERVLTDVANREKFFTEVDVLRRTDHPNIVRLYEFFEEDRFYHLVTEFIPGGELFDYLIRSRKLSEPIAAHFMQQLLSAVTYCHANNIVHRDLKPENLLLDREAPDATLKVIDFGTSTFYKPNGAMTTRYGTAYYIAPEVLRKEYTEKCDVWSCGVILYTLLSGKPPFAGRNEREILSRVYQGYFTFNGPEWSRVSLTAQALIRKMLTYNPETRISAAQALKDPWICQYSLDKSSNDESLASLDNLAAFRAEQRLQNAVLTFIASQLLCREDEERLVSVFKELDTDNDGKLSREELMSVYRQRNSEDDVDRIMEQVDVNKSGFIDFTEFVMAASQRHVMLSEKHLEAAFKAFDQNGDGTISARELKEVFGGLEDDGNEEIWSELIREVDLNGDGELDFEEFKQMMKNVTPAAI